MSYQCLCCEKRDAGHKYACEHCVNDMRRWLRELEDYVTIVVGMLGSIGSKPNGSIGTSFGSKPPMSLTPVALLDPRSTTPDAIEENSPAFDPVGAEEHDHIRSLPSAIHGIATWIREEREQSEPATWTLVSEIRFLRGEVSACAIEQWVDELHADLKELHHQARTLAKDTPRPLAPCLSVGCEGMVFWDVREENGKRIDQARCANPTCRRTYTGPDLVRLGAAREAG